MSKKHVKSNLMKSKTQSTILEPLPKDYAGWLNTYSRMTARINPQVEGLITESELYTRQNQAGLGTSEKEQFIRAFKTIIKTGQFADLVSIHSDAYRNRIHTEHTDLETNHRFLPWHRIFLFMLERRLNSTPEGDKIHIPYWDWTINRDIPEWLKDFKPIVENVPVFPSPPEPPIPKIESIMVTRDPGKLINPDTGRPFELPTINQVNILSNTTNFQNFTANLEAIHGLPHVWVGGTMATYVSPADPIFWLHHSNIDRLWSIWPKSQTELPNLQSRDAEMTPWSYRTDQDPIQDTKMFGYFYE